MRETKGNSYRIFSPAEVVKKLNMKMAAQKLSGYQFATCCYCLLDTKTLELTYARWTSISCPGKTRKRARAA
ncbi:MAG: SpoIIE family protein phosphatase [Sedimentisphaerales bacterium]